MFRRYNEAPTYARLASGYSGRRLAASSEKTRWQRLDRARIRDSDQFNRGGKFGLESSPIQRNFDGTLKNFRPVLERQRKCRRHEIRLSQTISPAIQRRILAVVSLVRGHVFRRGLVQSHVRRKVRNRRVAPRCGALRKRLWQWCADEGDHHQINNNAFDKRHRHKDPYLQ